jgi:hypothetical protein
MRIDSIPCRGAYWKQWWTTQRRGKPKSQTAKSMCNGGCLTNIPPTRPIWRYRTGETAHTGRITRWEETRWNLYRCTSRTHRCSEKRAHYLEKRRNLRKRGLCGRYTSNYSKLLRAKNAGLPFELWYDSTISYGTITYHYMILSDLDAMIPV